MLTNDFFIGYTEYEKKREGSKKEAFLFQFARRPIPASFRRKEKEEVYALLDNSSSAGLSEDSMMSAFRPPEGVTSPSTPPLFTPTASKWLTLIAACLGLTMLYIDLFIVSYPTSLDGGLCLDSTATPHSV
jgi:hypothetical protein